MTQSAAPPHSCPTRGEGATLTCHPARVEKRGASLPPLWGRDGVGGLGAGRTVAKHKGTAA